MLVSIHSSMFSATDDSEAASMTQTYYQRDILNRPSHLRSKAPKTHFPKRGDDEKVSIRNSNYKVFPLAYAERLKAEHPDIWRKGGNILGNTQFKRLKKVMGQNGTPKTPTDEKAIRLREAWSARHYGDHRLAGVVAQIKWLMVGSRGISHMKNVINEAKKKKGVHDDGDD